MAHLIDGAGVPLADVHIVSDGRLPRYLLPARTLALEEKRLRQRELVGLVARRANPSIRDYGVRGLRLIEEASGTAANWQAADGFAAEDVACDIWALLRETADREVVDTALNHIAEQMADMLKTHGGCPSGRVNRLIQVYMFLRDARDGVHLPPHPGAA